MRDFEHWYCHEHAHPALGLMTPTAIHFGTAEPLWHKRRAVLQAAYQTHPERFPHGTPLPPRWPKQVSINAPKTLKLTPSLDTATDTKFSLPVSKTP